jgi:hypothetical protein
MGSIQSPRKIFVILFAGCSQEEERGAMFSHGGMRYLRKGLRLDLNRTNLERQPVEYNGPCDDSRYCKMCSNHVLEAFSRTRYGCCLA